MPKLNACSDCLSQCVHRKSWLQRVLLVWGCLLLIMTPAQAEIANNEIEISIHALSVNEASVSEVIANPNQFVPLAQSDLGAMDNPWIKVAWDKDSVKDEHYLINDYVSRPFESYYLVRNNQIYQSFHSGHSRDFANRPITNFKFVVDVKQADYVLVNSCCSPGSPIFYRLLSDTELQKQYYGGLIWYAVIYAIISIMIVYNLFIFFYLREVQYLLYCYYLGAMLFMLLTLSGLGKQFIWPTFNQADVLYTLGTLNASAASLLFMLAFLDSRYTSTFNKKIIYAVITLHGIVLLSFGLIYLDNSFAKYANLMTQLVYLLGWIATNYVLIRNLLAGDKTAKILFFTYLMINSAGVLFLMRYNSFNYDWDWLEYAIDVAVVAEAIILSLALAQKIQDLRQQKLQAEQSQLLAQQRFSHRLLEVQESEKRELSNALHDNFTHQLLLLKTKLSRKLGHTAEEVNEVSQVLNGMRDLSHIIHPYMLEKLGLKTALQDIISKIETTHDIVINFAMDDIQLTDKQSLLIYRIIQEGLNNIVKHADASECVIALQKQPDHILVTIKDDGKGIDATDSNIYRGFGLTTIQERCEMLGGELSIASNNEGTTLLITFPSQQTTQLYDNKQTDRSQSINEDDRGFAQPARLVSNSLLIDSAVKDNDHDYP